MSCSVMIDVEFGASSGLCAPFDAVTMLSAKTSSVRAAPMSAGGTSGFGGGGRRRRRRRPAGRAGVGTGTGAGVGGWACAASRAACCCRLMRASRFLRICARLLFVGRVALEVLVEVGDGLVEVARLRVRARDVVEDVRVRKELVGLLELGDAVVVFAGGDRLHALLEVRARFGTGVGEGRRAVQDEQDGQQTGDERDERSAPGAGGARERARDSGTFTRIVGRGD